MRSSSKQASIMAQNPSASASASVSVELLPDWGVPTHPLRDAMGDQPPAYRVQPVSVPLENENADRYVRICPHQTLSFARFYEIATLPNIRNANCPDAMTKISTHHHDDLPENGIRLCTTKPASATNVPRSSYAFFVNVPSSPLGPGPGFSLKVNCQMGFPPDRDSSSKIKISKVLEEAKMWLCPHVKLNDSWVVDAIYGLFYPRERFDDPIEQYRAE
ncbi:hypothetical protein ABVK25_011224 [Lepraria finkii]|uniref:Uncharacterized protein n=1 Tax=Lepraria finkii TaxID=1340010 RepID=A0ABR4AQA4_9LECA